MIENHPELVEKYLRATLKGWEYALLNPDESIDYVLNSANAPLDREAQLKALKARKAFILPPDSKTPLGWMDRKLWEEMHANLLAQKLLDKPIDIDALYTNEFVRKIYGL